MKSRPVLALSALLIGAALGSVHGCQSGPAMAGPGGGGSGGSGGTPECPPVECVTPGPVQLTTYAEVFATLKAGGRVRGVFDYSKCKLLGQPGPKAIGAMNLDTFEWFGVGLVGNPKAYIAASENHLIHLQSGFVYDYVRVRIIDDETVTIDVQYADPTTFELSVDETIECAISDLTTDRGAAFFKTTP